MQKSQNLHDVLPPLNLTPLFRDPDFQDFLDPPVIFGPFLAFSLRRTALESLI